MPKLPLTLLTAFVCLGCSLPAGFAGPHSAPVRLAAQNAVKPAKWTVMVYIAGDNDLEEYVVKDIENELGKIGSNAQVRIVALADRTPGYDTSRGDWTGTKLFHVTRGLQASPQAAVADWGERNMGDPRTLAEFVAWTKQNHPAERYALYMWGHGWNWHPGYIMEDKSNRDALDPHELRGILPQIGPIDVVAYDGCNMGAIEVEAMWHGHATALVHSQEFVDWDGIEYDVFLQQLNQNPAMSADQLAINTTRSASINNERTGSAVAVDGRFKTLLSAVDQWSVALLQGLPRYKAQYAQAFNQTQHFEDALDEKDLHHLAELMARQVPDPAIQAASRGVMQAYKAVMLHAWHRPDYPQANGITITQLDPKEEHRGYYAGLDFARLTRWDEFMDAYNK